MTRRRGSSPLARGLLTVFAVIMTTARIIPARAGFTAPTGGCPARRWDHPRSRGVYADALPGGGVHGGSSPLARGLPEHAEQEVARGGIIPARAGFTWARPRRRAGGWDHPRSRGVYALRLRAAADTAGSSPLARGLRAHGLPLSRGLGIIPARAGFTRDGPPPGRAERDHPRSRGVYRTVAVVNGKGGGSSPLARGLRTDPTLPRAGAGIIPARAGFTGQSSAPVEHRGDHPRSRGVYAETYCWAGAPHGSSPLARGLQHLG